MSKYIVKNCPCYDKDYSCQSKDNTTGQYCQDCNNCIIKQIAVICANTLKVPFVRFLAIEVLQKLDIQKIK